MTSSETWKYMFLSFEQSHSEEKEHFFCLITRGTNLSTVAWAGRSWNWTSTTRPDNVGLCLKGYQTSPQSGNKGIPCMPTIPRIVRRKTKCSPSLFLRPSICSAFVPCQRVTTVLASAATSFHWRLKRSGEDDLAVFIELGAHVLIGRGGLVINEKGELGLTFCSRSSWKSSCPV